MKIGDKVKTVFGEGVIISREGEIGVFRNRFLVKLDDVSKISLPSLRPLYKKYGGLYFFNSEMEVIK